MDSVALPGRAGVAATQIGVGLRAFSYSVDGDVGYVLNPVIDAVDGELELVDEGCLSVPGLWFKTPRYPFARVRGTDVDGNVIFVEGTGLMAQALQHETDHLDGMLYLDRLEPETRREAMKQVRESDWF
jgi:peptide deformylase